MISEATMLTSGNLLGSRRIHVCSIIKLFLGSGLAAQHAGLQQKNNLNYYHQPTSDWLLMLEARCDMLSNTRGFIRNAIQYITFN